MKKNKKRKHGGAINGGGRRNIEKIKTIIIKEIEENIWVK
jgi:predicted outer membrane repeat protein